jgi:tRNA-dihydrouridine synthase
LPVKKVVQRNGGSGCLRDMDLVERIVRACIGATHLPVTVKTRAAGTTSCAIRSVSRYAYRTPARSAFTPARSHPDPDVWRRADWDEIAEVTEALDNPGHRQMGTSRPPTMSFECGSTPDAPAS